MNRELSGRYFGGRWPLFPPAEEKERETPVVETPGAGDMLDAMIGMMTRTLAGAAAGVSPGREELIGRIREIERSRSWKLTAPLRKLSSFFRKVRTRGGSIQRAVIG